MKTCCKKSKLSFNSNHFYCKKAKYSNFPVIIQKNDGKLGVKIK